MGARFGNGVRSGPSGELRSVPSATRAGRARIAAVADAPDLSSVADAERAADV